MRITVVPREGGSVKRFSRHIPKPDSITRADARTHLALLLSGCTLERLRTFTAEGLAASHKVPLVECQAALEAAVGRRMHG